MTQHTTEPGDTPRTRKADTSMLASETIDFAHRMFDAARTGSSELLLAAVDAGLPVNLTNDKGNTLLMLSAYAGHKELTTELLERKADANRLNDLGQSVIGGAVFKGYTDIVKTLMEYGADPRAGRPTAIEAAHMFGRNDLLHVLGAKEDDVSGDVPTPPSFVPRS